MRKWNSMLTGVLMFLPLASPAYADVMNSRPTYVNPANPNGYGEPSLQQVFDDITVGGPGIDAYWDQQMFAPFTNDASGGAIATMVIELTAGSSTQKFGIYQAGQTAIGTKAQIFDGSGMAGDQALISFYSNGTIKVNGRIAGTGFTGPFGFYLSPADGSYLYTEDRLNLGDPRALVYQGDNQTTIQIDGLRPGKFTDDEFVLAFEDGSDRDYQDFVVLIESISPVPGVPPSPVTVPVPGAVVIGGIGLGLVGWLKRRGSQ